MADSLTTIVQIGSITTATLTVLTTFASRMLPWLRVKITGRAVTRRIGTIFTRGQVEQTVRYYVEPRCQSVDPGGGEEPRLVFGVRQKLFRVLDEALHHPTEYRYILLLADSGMGKTSALVNYYARHLRKLHKPFQIAICPLGIPDAESRIAAIADKEGTILLLDAFDEDTQAIADHVERLRLILAATRNFEKVLITCRTQFFGNDEEIPVRTGILKVGARAAGEPAEYLFHKIYLSPFSDAEIKRYLRKRYPVFQLKRRRRAFRMVSQAPNLTVRPMLLSHVDDVIRAERYVKTSVELYEEMVDAWLRREEGFVRGKEELRRFSEGLAVDLYLKREARGAERIGRNEIETFAGELGIQLKSWALTGRSLLNRDAEGNYKFAHRSMMEYLFLRGFAEGDMRCLNTAWTDQMKAFFIEGLGVELEWMSRALRRMQQKECELQLLEVVFPRMALCDQLISFVLAVLNGVPIFLSEGSVEKTHIRFLKFSYISGDHIRHLANGPLPVEAGDLDIRHINIVGELSKEEGFSPIVHLQKCGLIVAEGKIIYFASDGLKSEYRMEYLARMLSADNIFTQFALL